MVLPQVPCFQDRGSQIPENKVSPETLRGIDAEWSVARYGFRSPESPADKGSSKQNGPRKSE